MEGLIPIAMAVAWITLELLRGLDCLTYSNISLSHTGRYYFLLVLAIFAIITVYYKIQRELRDYARLQIKEMSCKTRREEGIHR
jgi:hypothetical protein